MLEQNMSENIPRTDRLKLASLGLSLLIQVNVIMRPHLQDLIYCQSWFKGPSSGDHQQMVVGSGYQQEFKSLAPGVFLLSHQSLTQLDEFTEI